MTKPKTSKSPTDGPEKLFDRIVDILEQARGNVARAVNVNMVTAYWLIGQEIVEELQEGKHRAVYGKKIIAELSDRLSKRYGEGFSERNLQWFRQFYLVYPQRIKIPYPLGAESLTRSIANPVGTELAAKAAGVAVW